MAYCDLYKNKNQKTVCPHENQINHMVMSFQDSRGPSFSRSFQNQLYKNEEFCMQVDSHVDVVQGNSFFYLMLFFVSFYATLLIAYRLGSGDGVYVAEYREWIRHIINKANGSSVPRSKCQRPIWSPTRMSRHFHFQV